MMIEEMTDRTDQYFNCISLDDFADLAFDDRGLVVTIRRSKTDQAEHGHVAGPYVRSNAQRCPVTAVREMVAVAQITSGPMFRSFALPRGRRHPVERLQQTRLDGRDIALVVQQAL